MYIVVRESPENNAVVIQIRGKLDARGSECLSEALPEILGDESRLAVIDISQVEVIGSQAIGALVRQAKRTKEAGGEIRLSGANLMVEQTLAAVGMPKVMSMHGTVEEALSG